MHDRWFVRWFVVFACLLSAAGRGSITDEVIGELRSFVGTVVEPAAKALHANESHSDTEDSCFGTAAGRHLRSRCCVYFSNVAASLIESRYGSLRAPGGVAVGTDGPPALSRVYQFMSKWLLANANDPLAIAVGAEKIRSIQQIHKAARRLPAPVGRYSASITVKGIPGTLIKCEMGTTHTYLIFTSPQLSNDVIIDMTYKQFLVIGEWMSAGDFEVCETNGLFGDLPEWFVGGDQEFESEIMTREGLQANMEGIQGLIGEDEAGHPHWRDPAKLDEMHQLRNQAMFGKRSHLPQMLFQFFIECPL